MAANLEKVLDRSKASSAPTRARSQFAIALADIGGGLSRVNAWYVLGVHDVRARYRRTVLGPFWIVLSTSIGLIGMGVIWSTLFGMSFNDTFPYMTAGFVLWTFIQSIILESCGVFSSGHAVSIQRNLSVPKTFHVLRMVTRTSILFMHNIVIYVFAALYCHIAPTPWMLMAIPGVLMIALNGVWVGLLLGSVSVRFRDIEPLVASLLTVLFFLTPIVWHVEQLHDRAYFAHLNPFTHFIAIVRDPLLGLPPPLSSWKIVGLITAIGFLLSLPVFAKARSRLVFWI